MILEVCITTQIPFSSAHSMQMVPYFGASFELACDGNEVGFSEGGNAVLSDIGKVAWCIKVRVEELGAGLVY